MEKLANTYLTLPALPAFDFAQAPIGRALILPGKQ